MEIKEERKEKNERKAIIKFFPKKNGNQKKREKKIKMKELGIKTYDKVLETCDKTDHTSTCGTERKNFYMQLACKPMLYTDLLSFQII